MKVALIGVGRMGSAIAWAMNELGFTVTGVDSRASSCEVINELSGRHSFRLVGKDFLNYNDALHQLFSSIKPDVVISSLPYYQTFAIANYCIGAELRYCDLGGRVDVSHKINELAKEKATKPVMTDLGLAPGWVNILAEEGYRNLHGPEGDTTIEMMVGGWPDYLESNNNPLRYGITWSVDGLINEYKDDCVILEEGEIKIVKGMDGLEDVETSKLGKLEAFYTSGGASHSIHSMKERGVKNCYYKTLRYRGHCDIINFLIRDCDLDNEVLNKIFVEGCGFAKKDEVIILAKVRKGNTIWNEEKSIKSDLNFSAMQKATAYPISAVASLMAEGMLEGKRDQHRDYYTAYPKALAYRDIPFEEFNKKINLLGLEV